MTNYNEKNYQILIEIEKLANKFILLAKNKAFEFE